MMTSSPKAMFWPTLKRWHLWTWAPDVLITPQKKTRLLAAAAADVPCDGVVSSSVA